MKYSTKNKVINMHEKRKLHYLKNKRHRALISAANLQDLKQIMQATHEQQRQQESFCDQVNQIMQLFEQWNECERTVVMYALLKRLNYSSLKFLQYSISHQVQEYLEKQHGGGSASDFDLNANNLSYLQNLLNLYSQIISPSYLRDNSLKMQMQTRLSLFHIYSETPSKETASLKYTKDDVLLKFLNLLPLLMPKNNECKVVYMTLIPMAVQDVIHEVVSAELVQQILSYMLVHAAVTNEDRKALNVCLRCLERHLKSRKACSAMRSTIKNNLLSKTVNTSQESEEKVLNNWQVIAPPKKVMNSQLESTTNLFSAMCLERQINDPLMSTKPQLARADFERNGNEVEHKNIDISFNKLHPLFLDSTYKPRRGSINPEDFSKHHETTKAVEPTTGSVTPLEHFNIVNKQRSHSLTFECQRDLLCNKPAENEDPNQPKIGMSGIGLWLKSLRLHKYSEIFKHMTFENMLKVNEPFLLSIGVTKGASHKLSICIEKLSQRANTLARLEQQLLDIHSKPNKQEIVKTALEELIGISLSPMKPIHEVHTTITGEIDLAQGLLKNIKLVTKLIQTERNMKNDEEFINIALYVLDRALCNDALATEISALKDMKSSLMKMKNSLPNQSCNGRPYVPHLFGKKIRY